MKSFLAAMVALAVIAVGAQYLLDEVGYSSAERLSAPTVRLD